MLIHSLQKSDQKGISFISYTFFRSCTTKEEERERQKKKKKKSIDTYLRLIIYESGKRGEEYCVAAELREIGNVLPVRGLMSFLSQWHLNSCDPFQSSKRRDVFHHHDHTAREDEKQIIYGRKTTHRAEQSRVKVKREKNVYPFARGVCC
jgi:hypothetical protein